nr:MAG TPA: hypothetical protein [Caudoviricetes sp.]
MTNLWGVSKCISYIIPLNTAIAGNIRDTRICVYNRADVKIRYSNKESLTAILLMS